jgi:hypothetical protein
MSAQFGYYYYGHIDASATSLFKIPLYYDPIIICKIIEVRFNQNLIPNIRDFIIEAVEKTHKKI